MGIADLIIIGLIALHAILGTIKGLMNMLYKLVSYILSIMLAFRFAGPVALWLQGSSFYGRIRSQIVHLLAGAGIPISGNQGNVLYETVRNLPFPDSFLRFLTDSFTQGGTGEGLVDGITGVIMVIFCAIILFIVFRIIFYLFGHVVKGISRIPVIKQLDRVGGFLLGAAVGVLVVYLLLLGSAFLLANRELGWLHDSIEAGFLARQMYHNNPIILVFQLGVQT